jgi:secreted PhoX family phosphatase
MATMDRRTFLSRSAGFAGAGLFSAGALETLTNRQALASPQRYRGHEYGVLRPVADLRTGRELLALPKGFSYTTFGVIGSTMSDGNITPLALDGMAAFPHPTDPNLVRLIRNHEDRNGTNNPSNRVTPEEAPFIYDPTAGGGCSTLDYDPRTRTIVRDFVSLKGTIINCAGGYSMGFRHWLTGEETVSTRSGRRHGYVFPVPVTRELGELPSGAPIVAMGRFSHEAVATDMRTGVVYETEDPGAGVGAGFYRFLPNDPWDLYGGGKLQMLGVAGVPRADLRQGQRVGIALPVDWFDITTPDTNATNNNNAASVYRQGYDQGAAKFNRLEGIWWDGADSIFFASTSGGDIKNGDVNADGYRAGYGQIWQYRVNGAAEELVLVYESDGWDSLDSPDNLCCTPRGGLILCEDDASGDSDIHPDAPNVGGNVNRLIGFARDGRVFELAINILNSGELAGATFSPDGRTLFFNMLGSGSGSVRPYTGVEGMTFALTGPWEKGPL